jgi:predicted dehydrogenase
MLKRRPRLAFLGVGWIGRNRLQAVAESRLADICGFADSDPQARAEAQELAPAARAAESLKELIELEPDGLVIATPSAQHAREAIEALEHGLAVFCQKPLARNAEETAAVLQAAQRADRLLHVDLCYRHTAAMQAVRRLLDSGELGPIYNARLVFHNAYGPDKGWYRQRSLSGGGCVIDLAIHLVDAALWLLGFPKVVEVRGKLFASGKPLPTPPGEEVEDFASAQIELATGCNLEVACSWNLSAGCDAVIRAELHGPHGGAVFRNHAGSFYDFYAEELRGTSTRTLLEPPDAWGGRTVLRWVERLAEDGSFEPQSMELLEVASVLDRIYGLG